MDIFETRRSTLGVPIYTVNQEPLYEWWMLGKNVWRSDKEVMAKKQKEAG